MFVKVILGLVLLAFVSVQLADSLKCYTCDNVNACKHPLTVTCDQAAANKTHNALNSYYHGVKALNSKDFYCFGASSHYKNVTTMAVHGCVMKGAIDCGYKLINTNHTKVDCKYCNSDLCNKTNSVSAISASFVTIISLLALVKVFVL